MPIRETFYNRVLPELREKTEERGYRFYSKGTPGTPMSELLDELSVQPRVRHPFGIEGNNSVLVGFILIPKKDRKYFEEAWNEFDQNLRNRIRRAEHVGYYTEDKNKSLAFVIMQVWEREERCVLIPFKELDKVPYFYKTGKFKVLKKCGEFFLQKPGYEPIPLQDRLEKIFEFLRY